jgi:hypothetical protein
MRCFTWSGDPLDALPVSSTWTLVDPSSELARTLDNIRPSRGPQPITEAGLPREALTAVWDALAENRGVQLRELMLTVKGRDAFDNTLLATWADHPPAAEVQASVGAYGQRAVAGQRETLRVEFEGRFEECRTILAPVWPFLTQGDLDLTITVRLAFQPPIANDDENLISYRTAMMHANQGTMEVHAVPVRGTRRPGG